MPNDTPIRSVVPRAVAVTVLVLLAQAAGGIGTAGAAHESSTVYVDASATGVEDGSRAHPFDRIQEGVNHADPGDVVLVASGTYTWPVIVNKPLTLRADGPVTLSGGYLAIDFAADDVTIEGFIIENYIYGISGEGDGFTVANNTINASSMAIMVEGNGGTIRDNRVVGTPADAIRITNANDLVVAGNLIEGARDSAFHLGVVNDSTFEGNLVVAPGVAGFPLDAVTLLFSHRNRFVGNTVDGSTFDVLGRSSSNLFQGNIIRSAHIGVRSLDSPDNRIVENAIIDTHWGISLGRDTDGTVVRGNVVTNAGGDGIASQYNAGVTIADNRITDAGNSGITVYQSTLVTVEGNTVRGVDRVAGISLSRVNNSSVTDNVVDVGRGSDGIDLRRVDNSVVSANTVRDVYGGGILLFVSNRNDVHGNVIRDANWVGIRLNGAVDNRIFDNHFANDVNAFADEENEQNAWFVEPRPGPNVMGGPRVGGNFWSDPIKRGFSDTACDLDGDGFADEAYRSDRVVDEYPLVDPARNYPPSPYIPYIPSVHEGESVTYDASESSDCDGDVLSFSWDLDDDGFYDDATGVSTTVTFPDDGEYYVRLEVDDGNGGYGYRAAVTRVENVPPVLADDVSVEVDSGSVVTTSGSFSDVGVLDTHTVAVDWGDGTNTQADVQQGSGTGSFAASHRYADHGTYDVTVTVRDDDGGTDHAVATISTARPVDIDLKPGDPENRVNPSARGVIPVTVLAVDGFDPSTIDVRTLRLAATEGGDGGAPRHGGHIVDVDGDGDRDLLVHFEATDVGLTSGSTTVYLSGETAAGDHLVGTDTVRPVGRDR